MRPTFVRVARPLVVVAGLSASLGAAQRPLTPALSTSTLSGREVFQFYCASCHGSGGKGDGPVTATLRTQPPDLTTLTRRHGYFPADALRSFIAGSERPLPAHGTREMPVWGPFFRSLRPHDAVADVRIENVVRFVESLQKP